MIGRAKADVLAARRRPGVGVGAGLPFVYMDGAHLDDGGIRIGRAAAKPAVG